MTGVTPSDESKGEPCTVKALALYLQQPSERLCQVLDEHVAQLLAPDFSMQIYE